LSAEPAGDDSPLVTERERGWQVDYESPYGGDDRGADLDRAQIEAHARWIAALVVRGLERERKS